MPGEAGNQLMRAAKSFNSRLDFSIFLAPALKSKTIYSDGILSLLRLLPHDGRAKVREMYGTFEAAAVV